MSRQLYRLPQAVRQAVAEGLVLAKRVGLAQTSLLTGGAALSLSDLHRVLEGHWLIPPADIAKQGPARARYLLLGGAAGRSWASIMVRKDTVGSLYVRRDVINAPEVVDWAKKQGFKTTLPAEEMHVTVAYSQEPVDWQAVGSASDYISLPPGSATGLASMGPQGVVAVLTLKSTELSDRWQQIIDAGASWDWGGYTPHISISWQAGGMDLAEVPPFPGQVLLGPEVFQSIKDNWSANVTEKTGPTAADVHVPTPLGAGALRRKKESEMSNFETTAEVTKVDSELGLVMGWAIVCQKDGEPYFDLQGDHIPEGAMLKAAADFMVNSRVAGEMHGRDGEGQPVQAGHVVFAFPMTSDIAKAFGVETDTTGLMIAMKPDDGMLAKFKSGEYTGFSIGGGRITDEEVD